jgi:hypothetical protein
VVSHGVDASWLKVRELVFSSYEEYRGKNRKERKKLVKQLKTKLHGLQESEVDSK